MVDKEPNPATRRAATTTGVNAKKPVPARAGKGATQMKQKPAPVDEKGISAEIDRQFRLVPSIGEGWRWYDIPYRVLGLGHVGILRRLLPQRVRIWLNLLQNRLGVYNHLEREKIAWLDDPSHNLNIPSGEHIHLPKFWVLDFFSPSYVSVLEKRVGSRRWRSSLSFLRHVDLQASVKRARERDLGGSWERMVTFVPWGGSSWWPDSIRTRLPVEFDRIEIFHMPLGSALTAVVAAFTLSEGASQSIDAVLHGQHAPRLVKRGHARSVLGRMFAGIDDVQAERERLHAVGRDWLARELPGVFATEDDKRQPVLDLLLTEQYDPLPTSMPTGAQNYVRALGLGLDEYEEMVSPELPGYRLVQYRADDQRKDDRYQWALVGRMSDVTLRREKTGEKKKLTSQDLAIDMDLSPLGLFTRLGLFALLELKQRRAAIARDFAHKVHSRRPVASVKQLKASVLRSSLDLATIAEDITTLASSQQRYEDNVAVMHEQPGLWGRDVAKPPAVVKDLLVRWAERQLEEAAKLLELDRGLVRLLGVVATLTSSVESIRAQRWSIFLGALSLAAAIAAVWLSAQALESAQPGPTPAPTVTVTTTPAPVPTR